MDAKTAPRFACGNFHSNRWTIDTHLGVLLELIDTFLARGAELQMPFDEFSVHFIEVTFEVSSPYLEVQMVDCKISPFGRSDRIDKYRRIYRTLRKQLLAIPARTDMVVNGK
jgi:hypothetical protein